MGLFEMPEKFDTEVDPVLFDHALERATDDFRRVVMSITARYFNSGLTHFVTWPALLEIEEEAFSDLGFQSRNEAAVVAALPRIGPITLPGVDLNALIDWGLSAEPLPVAYRCVRDHLRSMSSAAQRGDEV
ncbi:DUF2471 domain-containing protein (plasmid) [Burkholderia vietnamiensis]|uniref:DUF2471 family protein n=1 Tax=Burkholderia vietnamiensis TaxID=60552 RepID=UPI001EE5D03C|nr:DUF2471 family protein [Burkholderia vietnamiensis]UKV71326.1 DUF2471 domain-containing protein [Burkholderia vietnamiensis]